MADKVNQEESEKFRLASESLADSTGLLSDPSALASLSESADKKKVKTKTKNGYNIFMSETLKKYSEQGQNSKEAISIISKEWKSLSIDQKSEYNKKAIRQNALTLELEEKNLETKSLTDAVAAAAAAANAVNLSSRSELMPSIYLSPGSDEEKEKKKKKDKKEKKDKKDKK